MPAPPGLGSQLMTAGPWPRPEALLALAPRCIDLPPPLRQAKGAVMCIQNFADPKFWEAIGEKQPQGAAAR